MKLNEITETGFYYQPEDTDRTYIYEVLKNTDEVWLKEEPEQKLLIDEWVFDYTDINGITYYEASGNLTSVQNASPVEVVKITDKKYKVCGQSGQFLVEDVPNYKEKLDKIKKICDKASAITQFVGGVEVKEAQKLALKVLKIIGE